MQNAQHSELKGFYQILFILIRQVFYLDDTLDIRQLLGIIEHHETYKKPGIVFIADFEKAFDKVRLDFIFKCLDSFSFGNALIKWVKNYVQQPQVYNSKLHLLLRVLNCQEELNKGVQCHQIYLLWPLECQRLKSYPITTLEDQKSKAEKQTSGGQRSLLKKKLQVCESQKSCLFVGDQILIFHHNLQINS